MSNIEAQLHAAFKKKGIVGASVAYIENGETNFYFFGKKSTQTNTPISMDSLFEIGSITKTFTTLMLLVLASKNVVNLDDSINMFLSPDKISLTHNYKITLRHLASHSSGFPSLPYTLTHKTSKNPYQGYTVEDLYSFLNHHPLAIKPGEKFVYSNFGMGLLAHLLCLKTKKPYETLLKDHILTPLSLQDTRVDLSTARQDQLCHGHNIGKVVEFWDTPEAIVGSGGICSNIRDMTQFLAANLGLITSPLSGLLKICHQRVLPTQVPDEYCGFAWIISSREKGDIIWHDGITGGFRSFIGFNQKTHKGLVILTNSREDGLSEFSFSFLSS